MLRLELLHLLEGQAPEVHAQQVVVVRLLSVGVGVSVGLRLGLRSIDLAATLHQDRIQLTHHLEALLLQFFQDVCLLLLAQLELALHHHEDEAGLVAEDLGLPRELGHQERLALHVHLAPQLAEVLEDAQSCVVLGDLAFLVEEHHVGGGNGRAKLEGLLESGLFRRLHLLFGHHHLEVHGVFGVVLLEVVNAALGIVAFSLSQLGKELLLILRPALDRQLGDVDGVGRRLRGDAHGLIAALLRVFLRHDAALEVSVPGANGVTHRLLLDVKLHHLDKVPRVVVGQRCRPSCADAVRSVHERHRNDWHVPDRLDDLPLLRLLLQQRVVVGVEYNACDFLQLGVNIPGAG
mmetsp:Transcript_35793/g.64662  ORF Transcript_35793/g.64662 Transcript_35793/m.64662 type:complete len:349 (-) Transcript_35793:2405-3451(-)